MNIKQMNKIYILAILLISSGVALSQSLSLSNQYLFNDYYISPAGAYGEGVSGVLGYRKQWLNLSNSPTIKYLSLRGKIANNMALGTVVNTEQYGVLENFNARLSYAYHVALTDKHALDFGLEGIYRENKINASLIDVADYSDQVLVSNTQFRGAAIDANVGLKYSFSEFQLGVGAFNLLQSPVDVENGTLKYSLASMPHFVLNSSYNFNLKEEVFWLKPVVVARLIANTPVSLDFGAVLNWKNIVNLGAVYRNNSSVIGTLGIKIKESFLIGYSYDHGFGEDIYNYATSTHEVFAGFSIGVKDKSLEQEKMKLEMESVTLNTKLDSLNSNLKKEKQANEELKSTYEQKLKEMEIAANSAAENNSAKSNQSNDANDGLTDEFKSGAINTELASLDELEKGYYIVVKSFLNKDFASEEQEKIRAKGYNPLLVFNKKRGYYYIYLEKLGNLPSALKELDRVKASGFGDAWLYLHE